MVHYTSDQVHVGKSFIFLLGFFNYDVFLMIDWSLNLNHKLKKINFTAWDAGVGLLYMKP